MYEGTDLEEYLQEIREQVCVHCIERPPGGPPCARWESAAASS